MSILLNTKHTNIGTAHRIARMVIGMAIIIASVVGAIQYSLLVDSSWFAIAMWPAAYLMFTGFTGVAPFATPSKQQHKYRTPRSSIGPFVVHTH